MENAESLKREFFLRPTLEVAQDLLGKWLIIESLLGRMKSEINEVEAYTANDPACHAANGRTKRNEVLFWQGGHLYVYFTYGRYFCMNVVTGQLGEASGILIRSIIPLEGIDEMKKNREKFNGGKKIELNNLANGPGKVCQALGVDLSYNGLDLVGNKRVYLAESGKKIIDFQRTARIGITKAKELQWRFVYKEM